jgi:tryptophan-rich sensory protein
MNFLFINFFIALGINILMFIPAFIFKTDKLTDISYAVTFVAIGLFGLLNNQINLLSTILFSMIFIWAFRLGTFLLVRIRKIGKDKRFDGMRENLFKFLRFWILQGISVWIILIPSIFLFNSNFKNITTISIFGFVIWFFGLLIESVADYQKYIFNNDEKNKNKWIDIGLWKYSRHPNYIGEILIWFGVYIFTFPALSKWQSIVGFISPFYITFLLIVISGIPLLEKKADQKWGKIKGYMNYKKQTGILFPNQTVLIIITILIALSAGAIGSIFTYQSIPTWYASLTKPFWNPPSWIFGPVWTMLYVLMGIASYFIWIKEKSQNRKIGLILYIIQLILNALWSILFFGLKNPGLAFAEIIILWFFIFINTIYFYKIDKKASYLLIPYLLWVTFAAVLNYNIWILNVK